MLRILSSSRKGFSILIALGSIGVLLIIVTSLASVYMNEMKLSRMQYNNVIAYAQAEWAFEYAMLKVANHREWFQDSMGSGEVDARMFVGVTPRTLWTWVKYSIVSQSNKQDFSFSWHLIIPLFSGTGLINTGSMKSYNPNYYTGVTKVQNLTFNISSSPENISWSIVAMSGGQNISLAGTWVIPDGNTLGVSRFRAVDCYDGAWDSESQNADGTCPNTPRTLTDINGNLYTNTGETVEYFYDKTGSVSTFLSTVQDPYLMIFNNSNSVLTGTIDTANISFTLPTITVTTEAQKGNSIQSIRFTEDKSKYYDAIRYGIYNNN